MEQFTPLFRFYYADITTDGNYCAKIRTAEAELEAAKAQAKEALLAREAIPADAVMWVFDGAKHYALWQPTIIGKEEAIRFLETQTENSKCDGEFWEKPYEHYNCRKEAYFTATEQARFAELQQRIDSLKAEALQAIAAAKANGQAEGYKFIKEMGFAPDGKKAWSIVSEKSRNDYGSETAHYLRFFKKGERAPTYIHIGYDHAPRTYAPRTER